MAEKITNARPLICTAVKTGKLNTNTMKQFSCNLVPTKCENWTNSKAERFNRENLANLTSKIAFQWLKKNVLNARRKQ